MPETTLTTTDLATLVIRGMSKSLFIDLIMAESTPKDFTLLVFRIFEGNLDPVEHIFQFQQKMLLESSKEAIYAKFSRQL